MNCNGRATVFSLGTVADRARMFGYGNNTLAVAFVWSTELYDAAEFSDTQKDVFM